MNTIILLLILMMMFGQYSQKYMNKPEWGRKWAIERIAPAIYYISGTIAICLCGVLAFMVVTWLIKLIGG